VGCINAQPPREMPEAFKEAFTLGIYTYIKMCTADEEMKEPWFEALLMF
jgi:hypothetical protein